MSARYNVAECKCNQRALCFFDDVLLWLQAHFADLLVRYGSPILVLDLIKQVATDF